MVSIHQMTSSFLWTAVVTMVAACGSHSSKAPNAVNDEAVADQTQVPPQTQTQAQAQTQEKIMRFGAAPQWSLNYDPHQNGPQNVDINLVPGWMMQDGFGDIHSGTLRNIIAANRTPYLIAYIATHAVKDALGTGSDCDGNSGAALCRYGAGKLRELMPKKILPTYAASAQAIAAIAGNHEVLIHFEPDWFQFSERAQAEPLSREEADGFRQRIFKTIVDNCSSCRVVVDFSPWFSPDRTAWATTVADFYGNVDHGIVKYAGLIGKPFPYTEGKIDNFSYSDMSRQLGVPLVVISAYTYGGGVIDLDTSWLDNEHLHKAAAMGIEAVVLSDRQAGRYDAFIESYRGKVGLQGQNPQSQTQGQTRQPQTQGQTRQPQIQGQTPQPQIQGQTPQPQIQSQNTATQSQGPLTPGSQTQSPQPAGGEFHVTGGAFQVEARLTSNWSHGYCKQVRITNSGSTAAAWTLRTTRDGTIYNSWSLTTTSAGGAWIFTGVDYNQTLRPQEAIEIGFCAIK